MESINAFENKEAEVIINVNSNNVESENDNYNRVSSMVTNFLIHLGFSLKCEGFDLVKDAIILIVKDESDQRYYFGRLTKVLYPELSKKYKKTPGSVERCIRYAIEKAFDYNGNGIAEEVMGNSYNPNKGRPTNGEFLYTIARVVKGKFRGEF